MFDGNDYVGKHKQKQPSSSAKLKIGIGKLQREGGRHKARILLMEEILHQLIGSLSHVYPIIYKVLHMPGGAGFLPSTGLTIHLFRSVTLRGVNGVITRPLNGLIKGNLGYNPLEMDL